MKKFIILGLIAAGGVALAANVIISPNMGMPVPVVGTTPGPDWANDINASLSIIDSHDHTAGHGVQVPPAGLNINSDLTFQGNNATNLRSTRFTAQGSPISGGSDLGALYVSGADLYYNDESGNQVRITQGGSVTGSSGTITGLPSGTASASFAASTFTFQSATNTPAIMAVGPVKIGTNTAASKTVTLAPPGGLAANYNLTFPNGLPGSTSFFNVDVSGNMATVASTGSGSVVLASGPTISAPTITSPTISGPILNTDGSGSAPSYSFSSSTNTGMYQAGNTLKFAAAGTDAFDVTSSGAVVNGNATVTGVSLVGDGSGTTPAYSFRNATNTGLYQTGDVLKAAANGVESLDVASTGLTVPGNITISGTGGNTPHACTRRNAAATQQATASCSAGEIVMGGGCAANSLGTALVTDSYPSSSTAWFCRLNSAVSMNTYAICCSI